LNGKSRTIHKPKAGETALETRCGHTDHLDRGQMRLVVIESALQMAEVSKCGTCFDEAGGY
jgi:hypothetical protein